MHARHIAAATVAESPCRRTVSLWCVGGNMVSSLVKLFPEGKCRSWKETFISLLIFSSPLSRSDKEVVVGLSYVSLMRYFLLLGRLKQKRGEDKIMGFSLRDS